MLAGTEAGLAEIRAGAGKRALPHVADFHLVVHAAWRLHRENREHPVLRVEIADRMPFRAGALHAALDFLFIRGAPIGGGCGGAPASFAGGFSFLARNRRHDPANIG